MPGDYSRKTFNPKKHYSGVLMQQGRVQLDADWNEQLDIQLYRTETDAKDVIGLCGVPKKANGLKDGFKIDKTADGRDLTISPGRIYAGGLLCELDKSTTYTTQPYLPNPKYTGPVTSPPSSPPGSQAQLSLIDGTYLVLLDAWKREITALDDRLIREVALGGPDTTTRLQNVWQVKLLPVGITSPPGSPPAGEITCKTSFPEFDAYTAPSTGMLNAQTQPPKPQENPCLLPPTAGYSRLENQLYRVEVHTEGARGVATFKWSRDNASVETSIEKVSGSVVTVSDAGKDEVLAFSGGQWVEIVDEESTLKGAPHALVQIDKVDPATREITMKTSVAAFEELSNLKLRRWDQSGAAAKADGVNTALASWIELEGGIQVQFSQGSYHSGDYWLIPARTATGEIEWPPYKIPNTNPTPQPPRGIRHHYCRLALIEVKNGVVTSVEDCRNLFPALTEICAEDVCFDNTRCDLPDAETVQDALDRLCAARDLRFHNKHLHGWGIVCGLQVVCGPDATGQSRRHVTVRPGYAIDCEGNDIVLDKDERIDLLDLIAKSQTSPPSSPLAGLADGEVCLVLESDLTRKTRFRVEPFTAPKSKMQSLLEGTLLLDFFNDCIKSLIDFVKDEFTPDPGEEKVPVGPTAKRITTFLNLAIQLTNKENGAFVFLSGENGQSGKNLEDTILRTFYDKLRAKLQSHTFCAMFEGARPFPEYPYSRLDIATIFGKGFQKRFRVSPNGKVGYAVGASNKVNVYDLQRNEMVDELEFPAASSAIVQDVAFSKDGKQLYAVATLNNKDSFFAVADVSGLKHVFRKPTMICDILLMTLDTSPSFSENVYAIGKGKGLYEINPQNVNPTPTPKYAFNAVGHLVIADKLGLAFASANAAGGPVDKYDRVRRMSLKEPENPIEFRTKALDAQGASVFTPGEDDIAVAVEGRSPTLYAVSVLSSDQSNKQVAVFNAVDQSTSPAPITVVDLGENTTIRLAHNPATDHMMVTYEDSYRIGLINKDNRLVPNYRHPVQISPLSIEVSPDRKRVYVLNYASNTISSIPAKLLQPSAQIRLQDLVDYRAGVLNAFADLVGGLLQYLKDCFCDHLLVNCPTCDPEDKLYLACISIKNGQVFKVCNFSLRKYVKSFPTIEYWLSVVPIIPLIKKAVEAFCCAVLPNFFGKFNAPKPEVSAESVLVGRNTLKSARIRQGVTLAQQADFKSAISERIAKFTSGRQLFTDFITSTANRVLVAPPQAVAHSDLVGQPVDGARKKLETAKITVDKVEVYDPNKGAQYVAPFTTAPIRLEEGARINLVTQEGKVLFYTRAEEPPPQIKDLRTEFEATRAAVAESKAEVDKTLPQINALTSEVEATKASLAENKAELAKATPQIESLRAEVQASKAELVKTAPQIGDLRARVEANTSALTATQTSVSEALRLREEVNNLRTELLQVRQTHQQELVARDKEIAELKAGAKEFQKNIQAVKELKDQVDKLKRGPATGPGPQRKGKG